MQLKQDEKPFGIFFGISLWMRSVNLRGGLGGEGRSGAKIVQGERRTKNEKSLKALFFFCPSACIPIKPLLLPADEGQRIAQVRTLWVKTKHSLLFAFSQKRRKLSWI